MIFVLNCRDRADSLQLRIDTRPTHVAYLTELNEKGKLAFAGPYLNEEGKPCGSLVALDVADLAEARELAAGDPYAKAGLFADTTIQPWTWTFNKPAGK